MRHGFYEPDKELIPSRTNHYGNTDYGHDLADEIIKKREDISLKKNTLDKVMKVFREYHPTYLKSASRKGQRLNGALGKLKRVGIDVGDYSKKDISEKWNTYITIMKQFDLLSNKEQ